MIADDAMIENGDIGMDDAILADGHMMADEGIRDRYTCLYRWWPNR